MKKNFGFIFISIFLLAVGCDEDENETSPIWPEAACHNDSPTFEPHTWPAPHHCDIFDSGRCCVYHTKDVNERKCYKEWCIWDEDCGWEYEGEFCPIPVETDEIENN